MFQAQTCSETVSIVRAILLGAHGACVDIGMPSLLGGIALFIGAVILLRLVGMVILRALFLSLRRKRRTIAPVTPAQDDGLQRLPYESPIRSTGAWDGKPR